jgi:hypothetical protein
MLQQTLQQTTHGMQQPPSYTLVLQAGCRGLTLWSTGVGSSCIACRQKQQQQRPQKPQQQ